jgi:hypothetical protein
MEKVKKIYFGINIWSQGFRGINDTVQERMKQEKIRFLAHINQVYVIIITLNPIVRSSCNFMKSVYDVFLCFILEF